MVSFRCRARVIRGNPRTPAALISLTCRLYQVEIFDMRTRALVVQDISAEPLHAVRR
jgi:hypothetical protein